MLVLSRKAGQTFSIGREITVTVVEVKGGRVRLAIGAPPEVGICRGELNQVPATPPPGAPRCR
jgi:carbon storage regulator